MSFEFLKMFLGSYDDCDEISTNSTNSTNNTNNTNNTDINLLDFDELLEYLDNELRNKPTIKTNTSTINKVKHNTHVDTREILDDLMKDFVIVTMNDYTNCDCSDYTNCDYSDYSINSIDSIDSIENDDFKFYPGNLGHLGKIGLTNVRSIVYYPLHLNVLPRIKYGKDITYVVNVDNEMFINDIIKNSGYDMDIDIYRQSLADFPRQNVMMNSNKINSYDEFVQKLCTNTNTNTNTKHTLNNKNMSFNLLAIMLICQTSFYMPYRLIHDKLESTKLEIMSKLISFDQSLTDNRLNYFVMNASEYNTINIINNNDNDDNNNNTNKFGAIISSHFRITDVNNEMDIYSIESDYYYNHGEKQGVIVYRFTSQC